MNELMERFEIIRLAVKLTDHDTVDLQIRKLRNASTDKRLHDILDELESKNFRQALYQMQAYVEDKEPLFHDADASEDVPPGDLESTRTEARPAVPQGDGHVLSVEEMLAMTRASAQGPRAYEEPAATDTSVSDGLFGIADDEESALENAMPDAPTDAAEPTASSPTPFDAMMEEETASEGGEELFDLDTHLQTPSESPSPTQKGEETEASTEEHAAGEQAQADLFHLDEGSTSSPAEADSAAEESDPAETQMSEAAAETEASAGVQPDTDAEPESGDVDRPINTFIPVDSDEQRYEAFPYMSQKFRNLLHQYPQLESYEEGVYPEAQAFIDRVSSQSYTESEVEAVIARYQELKAEKHLAEAAQMLIAAAATESAFAQFMLARELFKGEVLKPDHPEAFTQINHLAERNFPEAICDLGQLYEHGIGIDKNKRHALMLYHEAAEMGIARARQHYERLQHANPLRSITSLFKKRS